MKFIQHGQWPMEGSNQTLFHGTDHSAGVGKITRFGTAIMK
jgi:hypothetical protein